MNMNDTIDVEGMPFIKPDKITVTFDPETLEYTYSEHFKGQLSDGTIRRTMNMANGLPGVKCFVDGTNPEAVVMGYRTRDPLTIIGQLISEDMLFKGIVDPSKMVDTIAATVDDYNKEIGEKDGTDNLVNGQGLEREEKEG